MENIAERVVEAAVNTAEEQRLQADWYRRNACARHGVFYAGQAPKTDVTLRNEHVHQWTPPPTGQPSQPAKPDPPDQPAKPDPPDQQQPATTQSDSTLWWKKWWVPFAAVAAAALPIGSWWLGTLNDSGETSQENPPIVEQPDSNLAGSGYNSLIQYLEDQGRHLPHGVVEKGR